MLHARCYSKLSEGSEAEAGMDSPSRKICETNINKNNAEKKVIKIMRGI